MKTILKLFALAVGLAVFAGCNSPESRIKDNPQLFAQLSLEQQNLIKQGKVAVGFTPDMVRLALGDPDRVRVRTDAKGSREVWNYVTYESQDGVILYRGMYHRYWGGPYYPYYTSVTSYRVHNRLVVAFTNGRVAEIEETK